MRKLLLGMAICAMTVMTTPVKPSTTGAIIGAVAEDVTKSVASELAGSLMKSVLGAFASNIFSKLFGTPELTAEDAAKQLKAHFEQLALDDINVDTTVLATRVHDYIIKRNGAHYSLGDRRKDVRQILYETAVIEGALVNEINKGHIARYLTDFMVVTSTRLTYLAEQSYLEASTEVVNGTEKTIVTDHSKMTEGHRILGQQADYFLSKLGNWIVKYVEGDKTKVDCLKKQENIPWFTVDGRSLGNTLETHWTYSSRVINNDARHQACASWLHGDGEKQYFPSEELWFVPWAVIRNPKHTDQAMFRFKQEDGYHIGVGTGSDKEIKRKQVALSTDGYPDQLGLPTKVIDSWSETAINFGTARQRESAGYIRRYFLQLEKPL